MDKNRKKKPFLIAGLIAIFGAAAFFPGRLVYYRLYTGNRITGTVHVEVDDIAYRLDEKDISLSDTGDVTINDDGSADISIHAGEYGKYRFEISDTPAGNVISVNCFQFNWWNVQTYDLTIAIDTSSGTVTYSGEYTTIAENGRKEYETIASAQGLAHDTLQVWIGS